MDDVFVDKEKAAEMRDLIGNFEAVKQASDCDYPKEQEYENPQFDNKNDQTSFV